MAIDFVVPWKWFPSAVYIRMPINLVAMER